MLNVVTVKLPLSKYNTKNKMTVTLPNQVVLDVLRTNLIQHHCLEINIAQVWLVKPLTLCFIPSNLAAPDALEGASQHCPL